MPVTCTHLDQIEVTELPETDRRLRGVPEDRRSLGAPAHVHDVREDRLLRLLAEQARDARTRASPSIRSSAPPSPARTGSGATSTSSRSRSRRSRCARSRADVAASRRYWCTKAIAMLPSPTAAATRLTGLKRTSPHAKMPGTLVSSRYGSRSSSQRPDAAASGPVSTKPPFGSSAISGGSQSVSASAPMKMNSPPDSSRVASPVSALRTSIASSDASPCAATICVRVEHADVRPRRELVDEVARHALLEPVAAAEDRHACARGSRRTSPPAPPSCPAPMMWTSRPCTFGASLRAAPYEMPLPDEPVEALDRELPPRDAAREDDRPPAQHVAAVEVHLPRVRVDARDRARDEDLGAEPPRLLQRAARELVARHARGEAEVVLDPRRRPGLAARRLALDDDRPQSLGRAVHRGGEARRAGADDHRVVLGRLRARCRGRAARRPGEAAAARPSCRRRPGSRAGLPLGRERAAPLLGRVVARRAVTQLNVIWLRSRKRRSSEHCASHRCADDGRARRRRRRGEPLQAPRAAHPVARELADLLRRPRARLPRRRGSRAARCASRASARRRGTRPGRRCRGVIGTSPKTSPGRRSPRTRSIPSTFLVASMRPVEHREERPFRALLGRELAGDEVDVGGDARQPLARGLVEALEDLDRADLVRGHHRRDPSAPHGMWQP